MILVPGEEKAITSACETPIGARNENTKTGNWISSETLMEIGKRKQHKEAQNNSKTGAQKQIDA